MLISIAKIAILFETAILFAKFFLSLFHPFSFSDTEVISLVPFVPCRKVVLGTNPTFRFVFRKNGYSAKLAVILIFTYFTKVSPIVPEAIRAISTAGKRSSVEFATSATAPVVFLGFR